MSSAYIDPQNLAPIRHHAKSTVCAKGSRRARLSARLLAGAAFSVSMAAAGTVYAQEDTPEQSSGGTTVLEVITVEARRYGENPMDVPVSVSVVSEEKIKEERLNEIQDLAGKTVGVQMPNYGDDPRTVQPIVRGVGTLSTMLSPDNSTAPTIVDGVPMPAFAANGQLLDVGQVEVLRGPQGTLFGRNSTGGALNVFSVTPTDETVRQVTAEIGTDGYKKGELLLGGAINEELMGRFSMRYLGRGAYVNNDHPGQEDIGGFDLGAAKGTFLFTPGDATEVKLSLGFERYVGQTGYAYLLRDGNAWQETPQFHRSLAYTTLNVSHEFENFALKTTTGFTHYDIYNWADNSDGYIYDAVSGGFFPPSNYIYDGDINITNQRENQFYQEVRLQSLEGADTKWVVGGVFSYNDFTENAVGVSTNASINGIRDVNLTSNSSAVFFDIAQPLGEKFEIGGGMRYTHERKGIDSFYDGNGLIFTQDSSRNFDMLSGRVSLSYKLTEDSLLYGSISRGNKAGGYPRFTGNAAIGDPERGYDDTSIWAYELGWKAQFPEVGTTVSFAGFYNDVKDEAIFGFDPGTNTFPIENFDLENYGFEAEIRKEFDNGFSLVGGVTYTHSEITGIPANGVLAAKVGNETPNVPRWSGNLGIAYSGPADFLQVEGDPELTGYLGYRYVGKRAGDTGNNFELDPQHVVDARIGLKIDQTEFYMFGENLIGEKLEQQGANLGGSLNSVLVSRGRTIGIGVTTKF